MIHTLLIYKVNNNISIKKLIKTITIFMIKKKPFLNNSNITTYNIILKTNKHNIIRPNSNHKSTKLQK